MSKDYDPKYNELLQLFFDVNTTIEHLAEQQAIEDKWWKPKLRKINATLNKLIEPYETKDETGLESRKFR